MKISKNEFEKQKICERCGDKYCCHGLCREMNDFLIKKRKEKKK